MACGAPLIAADTGAIREIVADSACALIYPKSDANALKEAMERILLSKDTVHDLAQRGIARIKQAYTMEGILDLTEEVFSKVMSAYGQPFEKPSRPEGASV